jgi:hypothetical protein
MIAVVFVALGLLFDVIHWMHSFVDFFRDPTKHPVPLDEIDNVLEQMMHLDKNIFSGRAPVFVHLREQLLQFADIIVG